MPIWIARAASSAARPGIEGEKSNERPERASGHARVAPRRPAAGRAPGANVVAREVDALELDPLEARRVGAVRDGRVDAHLGHRPALAVGVDAHHRVEDVRLYPLRLTPEQLRPLFLAYLELGNHLARSPEFYNTVTANCTTVVWQLVRVLKPDLPLHRGLLLSGLLPDWLYQLGVLDGEGNLDALRESARITDRARAAPEGADFSAVIRAR